MNQKKLKSQIGFEPVFHEFIPLKTWSGRLRWTVSCLFEDKQHYYYYSFEMVVLLFYKVLVNPHSILLLA